MPSEISTVSGDRPVKDLERELAEAREAQAATAEILKVISSSPTDLHRVMATVAHSAARVCGANDAQVYRVNNGALHIVASCGSVGATASARIDGLPLTRGTVTGRAFLDRQSIHVPDLAAVLESDFPDSRSYQKELGFRTTLATPLLSKNIPIGVITIRRMTVNPFSDKQIAMLETFADEAIIAIENARLFEAEQASKRELEESLEYQMATSDILSVISKSPHALQPVLDAIIETAARLCRADYARFRLLRDGAYHVVARLDHDPDSPERHVPIRPGRDSVVGRVAIERRTIHIPDVRMDPTVSYAMNRQIAARTVLGVPLVKHGEVVGIIMLFRDAPRPFNARQVTLVETFANQALIAIENSRLFEAEQVSKGELQQSLEYQTATSDVLGVISRSPSQLQPVVDEIVQTAKRLCSAERATMWRWREGKFDLLAHTIIDPTLAKYLKDNPIPPDRTSLATRAVLEGRTMHVPDIQADPELGRKDQVVLGKIRTLLAVPLLRKGEPIGVLSLSKSEVEPFSDRQIALVETFADQAVIAIENTRLFEEVQARTRALQESLEFQTATSDVLNVISRSPSQLQPVFDAIAQSASRQCGGEHAIVTRYDGKLLHLTAQHNPRPGSSAAQAAFYPRIPARNTSISGRALVDIAVAHVPDIEKDELDPAALEAYRRMGLRAAVAVPMLHSGQPIGIIGVSRGSPGPFSDQQIQLLRAFADQAVIAIENTRLFEEVQARTRELAKTVEDLEIASQHKSQFVANMSHELRTPLAAILGYAELMQEGFYEPLGQKSLDALTRIRSNGKHLLGLINTVLDIAKIESGQFTLNMAEYAIESIVETVRSATESLAQNKKLALKTEVAKSLPVGLGDEQRLTQVLLNLVGNAIKFTDTGEVRVTARSVNGHFKVSVADTGPGIPVDHQMRIFEQFHQVDSSNTKAKGGTGLGLAIAKQIVEMHGGRIWVESTLGQGSTFQMELPARAELQAS